MINMKNIGVVLARLQPIHNGHIALIEKASKENDEVLVLIGSADKLNVRNPIPFNVRMSLALEALKPFKNVKVVGLDDLTDECDNSHEWGFYLYAKIVSYINQSNFSIYYSDGFEIITSWFPGFVLRNNVSLSLLARGACKDGISATKVRKMILDNNNEELVNVVPSCVYDMRGSLRQFMLLAEEYGKR